MFDGYLIYRVWHKKMGRYYAIMYNPITKQRTTRSWAKYVMSVALGRELDPTSETVDHINGDKTDDRLENLQLLPMGDNIRKSSKGRTMVDLVCPYCDRTFTKPKSQTGRSIREFCSMICSQKGYRRR